MTIRLAYRPRTNWNDFHASTARFRVAVTHRRAGKTTAFLNEALAKAHLCKLSRPHFGYVAPYQRQAKSIAWEMLKQYGRAFPGLRFSESELRADFRRGARLRLFGADNADALRGLHFDGVILDEFADIDPRAWSDVIRPALSDRNGWAAFAGTPRGRNHFYDLCQRARKGEEGWAFWEMKASETEILTGEELRDAKKALDVGAFAREYECSFDDSVEGAYFANEMREAERQGRIADLEIEPEVKIDTAWDIGVDDATAIWFIQDVARERRLIDYLEVSGEGLPQIVRRLDKKGYDYGRHIMPHDADARERSSGESYRKTFESLGFRTVEIVPRTSDLIGAINTTRLHIAACWFDESRCERGIEALKQYRREWDAKRQTWRERPLHDWTSHAADAFRTLALAGTRKRERYQPLEVPNYGIV
jgi:hypothetical protein